MVYDRFIIRSSVELCILVGGVNFCVDERKIGEEIEKQTCLTYVPRALASYFCFILERVCFILLSIASSRSLELLSFEQIIKEFVQERSILLDGVAD